MTKEVTVDKMRFLRQASILIPYVFAMLTILPIFSAVSANTSQQSMDSSEPLSVAEQWAVLNAALEAGAANGAATLAEATANRHEVLLVEVHQAEGSDSDASRAGDVYIYDYTTDTLTLATVELATGQVLNMVSSQGVQIGLTEAEIERASLIALGNSEILAQTEAAYLAQTGSQFTLVEQLSIQAQLFSANEAPNLVNMQSAECGIHRCALLSFSTTDGIALNVQPVVDLSTQLVVQNITDPGAVVSPPGNLGFSDTGQIVDETNMADLPGSENAPTAASDGLDLGITNPGSIIDESAIAQPEDTTAQPSVAYEPSQAPSQQSDSNDLGVVNPGMIIDDATPVLVGLEGNEPAEADTNDLGVVNTGIILDDSVSGPAGQEDAPNDLGFVNTGLILNDSEDEASGQTTTLGAAKTSVFIPFMARRLFKDQVFKSQGLPLDLSYQQQLFLGWWCDAVSRSPLGDEIIELCQQ